MQCPRCSATSPEDPTPPAIPPPTTPTQLPFTTACYMPGSSSTIVAILPSKLLPPMPQLPPPKATPKPEDCPLRDVAHAQKLQPFPRLVDIVAVSVGPGTIIMWMGTYIGGVVLSEDDKKGAMLYRWELGPPSCWTCRLRRQRGGSPRPRKMEFGSADAHRFTLCPGCRIDFLT